MYMYNDGEGEESYVKSEGYSIKKDNNHSENIKWNIDYDGRKAHVDMKIKKNGIRKHINVELNNKDLEELLSAPSINIPIHERLHNDFLTRLTVSNKRKTRKTRRGTSEGGEGRGRKLKRRTKRGRK